MDCRRKGVNGVLGAGEEGTTVVIGGSPSAKCEPPDGDGDGGMGDRPDAGDAPPQYGADGKGEGAGDVVADHAGGGGVSDQPRGVPLPGASTAKARETGSEGSSSARTPLRTSISKDAPRFGEAEPRARLASLIICFVSGRRCLRSLSMEPRV